MSMLGGSIVNSKLSNDSVSFGGVSVDLGSSDGTPFNLSEQLHILVILHLLQRVT